MKEYQIYITDTTRHGKMSRFSVSSSRLKAAVGLGFLVFLAGLFFILDYSLSVSRQAELKRLRVENKKLNAHIQSISKKVHSLESNIQKMEDLSFKLKQITQEQPSTGIGPLPYNYDLQVLPRFKKKKTSQRTWNNRLRSQDLLINSDFVDSLEKTSAFLLNEIWDVFGVLEEKKHLLRVTPSISPAQGWITSRFGYRDYPLSGGDGFSLGSVVDFHGGLDIASSIGTDVVAPADGMVVSTGSDKRTGNYIIVSHGYGLKTLYGHLDQILVQKSQNVVRGDLIGTIGNTGRSTGAHLHYEVRIANKPVNPEYYILD